MSGKVAFVQWLDGVLARDVPAEVVAYCFNIAQTMAGYQIELVGADEYDRNDPDWPCAECFTPRDSVLAIDRAEAGARWEDALQRVRDWVAQYLAAGSPGAVTLKRAQAVAVGFVDGDLSIVWSIDDEQGDSRLKQLIEQAIEDLRQSESPLHLKAALCRYLRRGAALDRSTGELVDLLGVSSPSILDRAGYSNLRADEAMRVLGTLTDEEIYRGG